MFQVLHELKSRCIAFVSGKVPLILLPHPKDPRNGGALGGINKGLHKYIPIASAIEYI